MFRFQLFVDPVEAAILGLIHLLLNTTLIKKNPLSIDFPLLHKQDKKHTLEFSAVRRTGSHRYFKTIANEKQARHIPPFTAEVESQLTPVCKKQLWNDRAKRSPNHRQQ
ncbi:hypothetical protein AVEN_246301-1 [Araneus ventricosus]|uniref:Uncharacterized protein n=2 Tax=Araneus ventricosus TaxID=182803 RepID=A0A4Y2HUV9_ARAVE|nr:hypothetical protein AVEN_246301-1 [Araneus ventricosus]